MDRFPYTRGMRGIRGPLLQSALVKRIVNSDTAEVAVEHEDICEGKCASCGGCARMGVVTVIADNAAHAAVGDKVTIRGRLPGGALASVLISLVYFIPVMAFLVFYAIAAAFMLPENAAIIISLIGLAAGWLTASRLRIRRERANPVFEIVEIDD